MPLVTPEIWQKLSADDEHRNISLCTQQDTLLHETNAISSVVDVLVSARQKNETPDCQRLIAKITILLPLSHVNMELSYSRRDLLRTNLSPDFHTSKFSEDGNR